jgi:uncharacterized protein
MMLPAMNSGAALPLPYRDLARRRARISRQAGPTELPRLTQMLATPEAALLNVELDFDQDAQGRATATVRLDGTLPLDCAGCAETLPYELALEFHCTIVESESAAAALTIDEDVVVASGAEITLAELVEDEVLLSLPERLCRTSPCEHLPPMAYPPEAADAAEADKPDNPFSVLAGLDLSTNRTPD